jgi:SnoaL-like domain
MTTSGPAGDSHGPTFADDHAEIVQLMARYCLLLDLDDIDRWVHLFTPDATYEVYGRTYVGHDGLRSMTAGAPGGLHLGGPPMIEHLGPDRATTLQNLQFSGRNGEVRLAVYHDELVRTADGWRIASRRCRFMTAEGLRDRP